jgi:hypothetical protein
MPQTVPSRPTNGATEPVVARIGRPLTRRPVTLSIERYSETVIQSLPLHSAQVRAQIADLELGHTE